jgi:hypothetical protein
VQQSFHEVHSHRYIGYKALNRKRIVNDELGRTLKEAVVAYFLSGYVRICLDGLEKITRPSIKITGIRT